MVDGAEAAEVVLRVSLEVSSIGLLLVTSFTETESALVEETSSGELVGALVVASVSTAGGEEPIGGKVDSPDDLTSVAPDVLASGCPDCSVVLVSVGVVVTILTASVGALVELTVDWSDDDELASSGEPVVVGDVSLVDSTSDFTFGSEFSAGELATCGASVDGADATVVVL